MPPFMLATVVLYPFSVNITMGAMISSALHAHGAVDACILWGSGQRSCCERVSARRALMTDRRGWGGVRALRDGAVRGCNMRWKRRGCGRRRALHGASWRDAEARVLRGQDGGGVPGRRRMCAGCAQLAHRGVRKKSWQSSSAASSVRRERAIDCKLGVCDARREPGVVTAAGRNGACKAAPGPCNCYGRP